MHILKHFKFFRVEMAQETAAFDIQSIADDMDGILRADFPGLIRPSQVVGIDGVTALSIDHQWFRSIGEEKILRIGIQGAFIAMDCQLLALSSEQGDGHVIQDGFFVLLEETSLLRINLPLHLVALGLSKGEFRDDGVRLGNGPRSGRRRRRRGRGIGHEQIDQHASQQEAETQ